MYLRDNVTVLRMHHSNGTDLLTRFESLDQLRISEHEHVAVRHKHFKATNAVVLHQRLHVFFDLQTDEVMNTDE